MAFAMKAYNRLVSLPCVVAILSFPRVSAFSSSSSSSSRYVDYSYSYSYGYSYSYSYTSSECIETLSGDGKCDEENNSMQCGYDAGDCCSCTCMDTLDYTCGSNGFSCIDPFAPCVDDDDVTAEVLEGCEYVDAVGDSYCDLGNNNAGCGYDGGDCCSCTCNPGENPDFYSCSEFACIDPEAICVDDDEVTTEMVQNCHAATGIGNGFCDAGNNNAECAYDAGDCCSCTCINVEDNDYACRQFDCIDPEAPCVDDEYLTDDEETMSYLFRNLF